ncbi:Dimeric alpha-beta barrel [Penicillium viridicatum]|nr:Dimeric alpha-beta barrel [Penicillium viridicatum]
MDIRNNRPVRDDDAILIWTRLQVPADLELEAEWPEYSQPLIRAPGHNKSAWSRVQERPDTILLVTAWLAVSNAREFEASPTAQLYWDNLSCKGIIHISSHETLGRSSFWMGPLLESYVQLFWIYFTTPITEAKMARIFELKGIRPPARGIDGQTYRNDTLQIGPPIKMWATHTESIQGQEAQLILWPHLWRNAKTAEWRYRGKYTLNGNAIVGGKTKVERFSESLEEEGPMEWREEFVDFKPITYV